MEASESSILCVDDNEDTREILTYLLEEKGFAVTACKTLDECLEQARQKHFSVIVLDYHFGDGTSLDVCREIRSHNPATPILFYSGEARETEIQKALEAGGTEYLVKPLGFDELIDKVGKLTRKAESA
jgi:DNA-binding response OmpR family regulator